VLKFGGATIDDNNNKNRPWQWRTTEDDKRVEAEMAK
jgi:hypothetical protein